MFQLGLLNYVVFLHTNKKTLKIGDAKRQDHLPSIFRWELFVPGRVQFTQRKCDITTSKELES